MCVCVCVCVYVYVYAYMRAYAYMRVCMYMKLIIAALFSSDIQFVIGEERQSLYAHKCILAARYTHLKLINS